jgi:hypothetical protein
MWLMEAEGGRTLDAAAWIAEVDGLLLAAPV